jgi:hypothetical protein
LISAGLQVLSMTRASEILAALSPTQI